MNWVDLLLAIIIGFSVITGFSVGFARVGIGTAAAFAGIFAGFWCYGMAAAYIVDYVSSRAIANLLGFLVIFLAIVFAGAILGRLLAMLFKWIGLSWADRLLGGAFGVVRGVLIAVALVTVLLAFAPSPPPQSIVQSKALPYVVEASNILSYATPHEIKDAFHQTQEKVKRVWSEQLNRRSSI